MATIERIRQRSGLLIVVVFVALMAFLLGDLFQSGGSRYFADPNVVGSVNGDELSRMEMSQKIEELRTGNPETYANSRVFNWRILFGIVSCRTLFLMKNSQHLE